jgi:hypothetical protein
MIPSHHGKYHDFWTSFVIFRISKPFDYTFMIVFLNKMFKISFHFMIKASN